MSSTQPADLEAWIERKARTTAVVPRAVSYLLVVAMVLVVLGLLLDLVADAYRTFFPPEPRPYYVCVDRVAGEPVIRAIGSEPCSREPAPTPERAADA